MNHLQALTLHLTRRSFTQHLQRRGEDVRLMMAGADRESGLIGQLSAAALTALRDIDRQLGLSPTLVDAFV
jgi:hypothetical protein